MILLFMHIYRSFSLIYWLTMRYYLLFVLLYCSFHSYAVILLFIFAMVIWRVKMHNGGNQFIPTYYEMILYL